MKNNFNSLDRFEFESLRHATNYKNWIHSKFSHILDNSKSILEIGGGIGQFTQVIQQRSPAAEITSLEPNAEFHKTLSSSTPGVKSINAYSENLIGKNAYDTIININVLEHIKDDLVEIQNWNKLLNAGGHVCILVPACQEIYAPIDHLMGHYRRYSIEDLSCHFEAADFEIETIQYFNFLGYWLWLLNFKLLKNTSFSESKVIFHDRVLIYLSKALDALGANRIKGQSLICIARKRD